MYNFSIGVMLESFRTDRTTALKQAVSIGASGIQVYATQGELAPEALTGQKRKDFLHMVKEHGLKISALCGDLGQPFVNPDKNPALVERSKRILDLAKDLETDIVTTHIGVIPEDPGHERYKILQEACFSLAQYADSNLVMVTGDDPVQAVYTLKDYIVHTHAKDGRRNYYRSPEAVYGLVEDEMLQSPSFTELPLGEGSVPFPEYLKALDAIGYHGFLTIEREVGADPEGDIRKAADFLNALIR